MFRCDNKYSLFSNTNGDGTYEFRMDRREAQSQVTIYKQPTDEEINERVRGEIMSCSRIRLAFDSLYLRSVRTRF